MQPTKLALELAPGNLYGWLLPPMKTLLDESIEKVPEVVHFSLYVPSTVMVTLKILDTYQNTRVYNVTVLPKGNCHIFRVGYTNLNTYFQSDNRKYTLL